MGLYETLIVLRDYCKDQAKIYSEKGDKYLTKFYLNASIGYDIKAQNLKVGEA